MNFWLCSVLAYTRRFTSWSVQTVLGFFAGPGSAARINIRRAEVSNLDSYPIICACNEAILASCYIFFCWSSLLTSFACHFASSSSCLVSSSISAGVLFLTTLTWRDFSAPPGWRTELLLSASSCTGNCDPPYEPSSSESDSAIANGLKLIVLKFLKYFHILEIGGSGRIEKPVTRWGCSLVLVRASPGTPTHLESWHTYNSG